MAKFYLSYHPQTYLLAIGQVIEDSTYIVLAERDPEVAVDFKPGSAYFNPLLKPKDATELFLFVGGELVSYHTGKPPIRFQSKAEQTRVQRGWFELPARALTKADITPDIMDRIYRVPKLTGVIQQILRSGLGLRVPDDLQCETGNDWAAWIYSQQMAITPCIRNMFTAIKGNLNYLKFSAKEREFMLTGQEPEPVFRVKLRWCKVVTTTKTVMRLYESQDHEMIMTKAQVEGGNDEILKAADQQWGLVWRDTSTYVTGQDTVETKEEIMQEGPLIFVQVEGANKFQVWCEPPFSKPKSDYDIINEAIERQENNG
jgi:hypothetical protein